MVLILGIESTAHTFGVGIIDEKLNILSDVRKRFQPPKGMGIEPFMAAEHHSKYAAETIRKAFDEAGLTPYDMDAIAYSMGPGLGPCLRVGATLARALSLKYKIPLYGVHHAIGHLELVRSLAKIDKPIVLLVSGGHTVITAFKDGRWRSFGETLDITVGNLLDVFAREVGLDFPGGPVVERLAKEGKNYIELPYNIKGSNFQFSGILTKAIQLYNEGVDLKDLAYSVQETAFSILVEASERALTSMKNEVDAVALTGGVASNDTLYEKLKLMSEVHGLKVYRLPKKFNGDNGVQIAVVGLRMFLSGYPPLPVKDSIVKQRWRFDEVDIKWIS